MNPLHFLRQLAMFERQRDWIVSETLKWLPRRMGPRKTKALRELSRRAGQALREREEFLASVPDDSELRTPLE